MRPALLAIMLAGLPPAALAQSPLVTVSAPWARATAGGQNTGAAYLTLLSPAPDQLTGASTPVADAAEVHENVMDGTVMRMRSVPFLDLPAGNPVTLAPGGYHIMLMHLHAPLVAGQSFPLRLTFAHAGPMDVMVSVAKLGASGPPPGPGAAK